MKFDAIILGSGLGGLQCAYILAKNGMRVCVLEKNSVAGGCLQSFKRKGEEFDTGFHYIGALGEGQILNKIFNYFGLDKLPWHQLDTNGFDEIYLDGKSYLLHNGYDSFADSLSESFPQYGKQIRAYASFLSDVGRKISDPLTKPGDGFFTVNKLLELNAWEYLQSNIGHPQLINTLSGNSLILELKRETLPLYTFAQINASYIQSAWRLKGGGSMLVDTLIAGIRAMGGEVCTSAEAVEIVEKNGLIDHIIVKRDCKETESVFADLFISGLSPQLTLELLKKSGCVRPIFRNRISRLEQTYGFFTVNIKLKDGKMPYYNRNFYCYAKDIGSVWDIQPQADKGRTSGILVSQRIPDGKNGNFSSVMDILAPMSFNDVRQWEGTTPANRPQEYKEFKHRKAEECIAMAENVLPGLRESIETYYTSTPLTYQHYTGAIQGTAYGIRKDCNNLFKTLLAPKTPVPNLFFTGQNLNLHGVLGVSITSLMTCSEILGKEPLVSFLM